MSLCILTCKDVQMCMHVTWNKEMILYQCALLLIFLQNLQNPNSSLLPLFAYTSLFPLFYSFLYLSLMSSIESHATSFIPSHSLYCNVTLKSLSPSYWLMGGITNKDGSGLIVYYEKVVTCNVYFTLKLLGWKCEGWINIAFYCERAKHLPSEHPAENQATMCRKEGKKYVNKKFSE